jgi:chromosomal replication initiation ATPase DnaA
VMQSDRDALTRRTDVGDKAAEIGAEMARLARPRPNVLAVARGVLASCDRVTQPAEVIALVAAMFGVLPSAVGGRSRRAAAVAAREVAALTMATRLRMSYPEVNRWVGCGEWHSGPMLAAKRLAARLSAADGRPAIRLSTIAHQRRAA